MAIHNWIRCHWRNGRQILHDVPETWHEEIEAHLSTNRGRARDLGRVRIATLASVEIAWVECQVPLGSPERDLTYRQARAVHALVRPCEGAPAWTRAEAEILLASHYGEAPDKGLVTQHRVLTGLDHPHDLDRVEGLFVGHTAPLPSDTEPAGHAGIADGPRYAQRHLIDTWEEWVAEGGMSQLEPPTPMTRPVQSPAALMEPMIESVSRASSSEQRAAEEMTSPPVLEAIEPLSPLAPLAPLASMEPLDVDETEPELFDLSGTGSKRTDEAPTASLSGLLGPSHTTQHGA